MDEVHFDDAGVRPPLELPGHGDFVDKKTGKTDYLGFVEAVSLKGNYMIQLRFCASVAVCPGGDETTKRPDLWKYAEEDVFIALSASHGAYLRPLTARITSNLSGRQNGSAISLGKSPADWLICRRKS